MNLITILIWHSPVIPELPQIKSSSDERNFGGRMMWRVIKGHVNRDCIRRIPNVSQMTQKKALPQWRAGTRANYLINLLIWFVTFKSVKSDRDTIGNKNRIKSWRFSVMDESGDDVMVAAHCGRLRNYSCLCSALLSLPTVWRSSKYVKQIIWTIGHDFSFFWRKILARRTSVPQEALV